MSTAIFMDLTPLEHIESAEMDISPTSIVTLFSWNPSDKKVQPYDRNMKWETMITLYFKHLTRCCKYFCIVPEFSDVGRLHCHGWIIISDKIKWLKSVLPRFRNNGSLRLNPYWSPKALNYYKKDLDTSKGMLEYPYPYTHYTNDDYLRNLFQKHVEKIKVKPKYLNLATFFGFQDSVAEV